MNKVREEYIGKGPTIIAGPRKFTSKKYYWRLCSEIMLYVPWEITKIISGGARGMDEHGENYGARYKIEVERHPIDSATWSKYGKMAGPLRNQKMANRAYGLILLWDGESHGSRDMLEKAKQVGLKIHEVIIRED